VNAEVTRSINVKPGEQYGGSAGAALIIRVPV
jgi:hypothetical protein